MCIVGQVSLSLIISTFLMPCIFMVKNEEFNVILPYASG